MLLMIIFDSVGVPFPTVKMRPYMLFGQRGLVPRCAFIATRASAHA